MQEHGVVLRHKFKLNLICNKRKINRDKMGAKMYVLCIYLK